MKFNPGGGVNEPTLLAAGSWDNLVRIWQVNENGQTEPKAQQNVQGPVLALDWSDDGSKIFIASADKQVRAWDLASNQIAVIGTHDQPVKSCHWVKAPNYSCLMTGSWDRTLRFWDLRQAPTNTALATLQLPERVFCADVSYPMGVVGLANRQVKIYNLENQPQEVKTIESPLKYQHRCISVFKDRNNGAPTGFTLGSIEGRVAIQYVEAANPKDNFTFKCHRSPELNNGYQDIFAVNDIAFHPQHGTLATTGSDGRFSYWDKDARTKLKTSEAMQQPITCCCFNAGGQIFAYAVGYDWSKGHEHYNPQLKNYIFLHACSEEMKPRQKNK